MNCRQDANTEVEAALRDELTNALFEKKQLMQEKREAVEAARESKQAMQRMQQLHAQEIADAQTIAASLRQQIASLRQGQADKDKLYARNLENLKRALGEMEISSTARETYAADGSILLRKKLEKTANEAEEKQNLLSLTEGKLHTVTGELDRVYHEYASATRLRDRALHQAEQAEHLRDMDAIEYYSNSSAERYERQQRCAIIQQEKVEAVHHMRESLSSAYGNLMLATREKVQTASVLGVVTDEAREILAARNKYENDNSNLLGENKLQRDKMKALEEAKGWAEERLNIRNDEASVNRARIQSLTEETTSLHETLCSKQEYLDDVHFALTPLRL